MTAILKETITGFIDDTVLVITAKSKTIPKAKANNALAKIEKAIKDKGLHLATEKTEVVILYRGQK